MLPAYQKGKLLPARLNPFKVLVLGVVLLAVASCASAPPPPPPPPATPSIVITEDGMEYYLWRLKLPGTRQDLKLRQAGALIWIPLTIIQYIRFSGPVSEGYRQADISLSSGERMQGEVFVSQLIEGNTDVGYWNMSLERIRNMSVGME